MENILIVNDLHKKYSNGVQALNNISLKITNGMFGLLGPNGAGKSTLMKTIVGLQSPDQGEISFNNVNVCSNPEFIRKRLGFLPQDFGVYPRISAYDLLNHIAILKGVSNKKERRDQLLSLLQRVNLYAQRNKEVHHFSGGMRQRFGVAQALLGNPDIIIVDEPTAGLDPEERYRFAELLSEISSDRIIILSTHLVEDVYKLCSNMAIIKTGKLLAHGSPKSFVEQLSNKIWSRQIEKTELEHFKSNYEVISSHYIGGKLNVKIYSENSQPAFDQVDPTLEDFYFKTLKNSDL